ncbi:MAG: acetoacetate decarboxylase family protein [Dongiaceae bacterium]
MNNIPLHAPLFPPSMAYGSDDAEAMSLLVEADEAAIRRLLEPTPFAFVSAHAWIEIVVLHDAFGVQPFAGGGVIVPARYRGTAGGYYAFCYIDTDDALALGREPFGYPKKIGPAGLQKTGRAVTAFMKGRSWAIEMSVVTDGESRTAPPVPRYPHLLLQVFPSAESTDVLLKRVIARDTAAASRMTAATGEGAIGIPDLPGNELAWLAGARPVFASYARGAFRGALGTVLGTETIGAELSRAMEDGRPREVARRA